MTPLIIDRLDTAVLSCPACHKEKAMLFFHRPVKKTGIQVKCRCKCGHTFFITLASNRDPAPSIRLAGTCSRPEDARLIGKMVILKIDPTGVLLKTDIASKLRCNQRLLLEFVLNDAKQSLVRVNAVIKARNAPYLSAYFTDEFEMDATLSAYFSFNRHLP